jgi:hypothetical protein
MWSPGHPPGWRREHRQQFWAAIARGLSSEDAAATAGLSQAVGSRWFREGGGMPTVIQAPLSGRYLSFGEREEIALLHAQERGLGRLPISLVVRRRRFPVSCGVTLPPAEVDLTIALFPLSGTLIGADAARNEQSWPRIRR